jgi:hypothetical protein
MTVGDNLPDRLSLKPSKLKWAIVLLISLTFVLLALFVIPPDEDPTMRWLTIGFFGLGILASIPGLLGIGGLDLDREGFTISAMGRKSRRTWRECSEFSILSMRGGPFVGFSSKTDEANPASAISRGLVGETGMLPDKYGMKAKDLAALMNRFRARALAGSR